MPLRRLQIGVTWSTIATAWIYVLTMGLLGWLFPRLALSLVAVAIGDGQSFWAARRQIVTKSDCSIIALGMLVATAPFLLVSTIIYEWFDNTGITADLPNVSIGYILTKTMSALLDFLAMLVFASLLSLFYRARVVERRPPDESPTQAAV